MNQKKKAPEFAERKKAFDAVMKAFRNAGSSPTLGAMQYNDSSGGSPNPAKPTPLDFRCDVDRVIQKCVGAKLDMLVRFFRAYVIYDSDDPIEIEKHADKIFGERRHSLEQGMGAEFKRRKLYPTSKYFKSIRKPKKVKK